MTGRDLLCAISQADETYLCESERFSDVSAEIKKERPESRPKNRFFPLFFRKNTVRGADDTIRKTGGVGK